MKPRASICIAVRNRREQLAAALASIKRWNYEGIEVCIVDDGSGDGTRQVIQDNAGWIKWDSTNQDKYRNNPAVPFNMAHRLATSDVFLQQNSEVMHLTPVLEQLLEVCRPGHVALATVYNCTITNAERLGQRIIKGTYHYGNDLTLTDVCTRGSKLNVERVDTGDGTIMEQWCGEARPVPFLFCGAIHRSDWEAVGGYSEDISGNNDGDLAKKLAEHGVKWHFLSRAVAAHLKHAKT